MTSVRKRKMARSSVRKVTRRTKDKQRNIKIYSNPIIEANWDKSLTLQQNYRKLGLTAKLGSMAGGGERKLTTVSDARSAKEAKIAPETIEHTEDPAQIPEGEARIIRDANGSVERVIYGTMKVAAHAAQPQETSRVVSQLEQLAQKNAAKIRERKQSDRENEWLQRLYEKHGDDYDKMMWDKSLNIYQQSAGDLKRRINKWKKAQISV